MYLFFFNIFKKRRFVDKPYLFLGQYHIEEIEIRIVEETKEVEEAEMITRYYGIRERFDCVKMVEGYIGNYVLCLI